MAQHRVVDRGVHQPHVAGVLAPERIGKVGLPQHIENGLGLASFAQLLDPRLDGYRLDRVGVVILSEEPGLTSDHHAQQGPDLR